MAAYNLFGRMFRHVAVPLLRPIHRYVSLTAQACCMAPLQRAEQASPGGTLGGSHVFARQERRNRWRQAPS
jgi:hypothetical protein